MVAQNPAFLLSKFGSAALGPYTNALSKYGEKIVLRNAAGNILVNGSTNTVPSGQGNTSGDPVFVAPFVLELTVTGSRL